MLFYFILGFKVLENVCVLNIMHLFNFGNLCNMKINQIDQESLFYTYLALAQSELL